MTTVNGWPLPRIGRANGAAWPSLAALVAAGVAGCGGVTGGRVDLGYPTARPHVVAAATMQPRLSGRFVRFTVPAGWGLARIGSERGVPRAFVRLDGDCYESVAITGSSAPTLTGAEIAAPYANPVDGYPWSVTSLGHTTLAVLGQRDTTSGRLSRSSLGTAYLPTSAHAYLAIDFGAGIWPLGGHACSDSDVSARLSLLAATISTIFASARLVPGDGLPSATGVAAGSPPGDTAIARIVATPTALTAPVTAASSSSRRSAVEETSAPAPASTRTNTATRTSITTRTGSATRTSPATRTNRATSTATATHTTGSPRPASA